MRSFDRVPETASKSIDNFSTIAESRRHRHSRNKRRRQLNRSVSLWQNHQLIDTCRQTDLPPQCNRRLTLVPLCNPTCAPISHPEHGRRITLVDLLQLYSINVARVAEALRVPFERIQAMTSAQQLRLLYCGRPTGASATSAGRWFRNSSGQIHLTFQNLAACTVECNLRHFPFQNTRHDPPYLFLLLSCALVHDYFLLASWLLHSSFFASPGLSETTKGLWSRAHKPAQIYLDAWRMQLATKESFFLPQSSCT